MKDDNRDLVRLHHMHDAISEIQSFILDKDMDEFIIDSMLHSACIRQLEIIGEAAGRLSEALKENYNNIGWREITGLRNILVHEYFGIDLLVIYQIIRNDLPNLKSNILQIINALEK